MSEYLSSFFIFNKFITMKKIALLLLLSYICLYSCSSDDENVDSTPPSAPSNLIISNITDTSLQLNWNASTDNISVSEYHIIEGFSGNVTELPSSSTSYVMSGLIPETTYRYVVIAVDASGNPSQPSNSVEVTTGMAPLEFKTNLSEMGVFEGELADLNPALGVQLYEINSTLFTDYSEKQRLIRFPNGQAMRYNESDFLPIFPDNTLIAKTFFYYNDVQNPGMGKKIIETRILLKIEGNWHLGNYVWNATQSEATYSEIGSVVPISYIDESGANQNIDYIIPSQQDCVTCHNNSSVIIPIGPKLRSMNFVPSYTNLNQLEYLIANGMLEGLESSSQISVLPDWTNDVLYSLEERSRAYIDINCAHCHQPGGDVSNFDIDFRYETPYGETGIYVNRGEIEARIQSVDPAYRMPRLGRTVVHEEAVTMLLAYLDSL